MNRSDKWFKKYYEQSTQTRLSEEEFHEMKGNLLEFYHILDRWYRERQPQRDLNPELFETQLVDE
jgi:hypothetical protein